MLEGNQLVELRLSRTRVLAALLFALVVAVQPSVVLANHTANCSEYGIVHRWMGYTTDIWSDHRYAVRATLSNAPLDLCTNPRAGEGSSSVAWVAIEVEGQANCCDIVQVGFGKCYPISQAGNCNSQTTMHDFYAYGRDPNSPGCSGKTRIDPTGHWQTQLNAGELYSVREFAAKDFWIDAGSPGWSLYLSSGTICWTNDAAVVLTESWDYGDALGGRVGWEEVASQGQFKVTPSENWRTLPMSCNARAKDGGTLESVFKCYLANSTINLYTDR